MNKKVALLSPNFEWKLFTLWYENSTLFGLAPLIYALRGGADFEGAPLTWVTL